MILNINLCSSCSLNMNLKDFSFLSFFKKKRRKMSVVLLLTEKCPTVLGLHILPPPLHPLTPPSPHGVCRLYHLSVVLNVYSFWNTLEWKVLWNCKVFLSQSSANMSRSWHATPLLFQCCDGDAADPEKAPYSDKHVRLHLPLCRSP